MCQTDPRTQEVVHAFLRGIPGYLYRDQLSLACPDEGSHGAQTVVAVSLLYTSRDVDNYLHHTPKPNKSPWLFKLLRHRSSKLVFFFPFLMLSHCDRKLKTPSGDSRKYDNHYCRKGGWFQFSAFVVGENPGVWHPPDIEPGADWVFRTGSSSWKVI